MLVPVFIGQTFIYLLILSSHFALIPKSLKFSEVDIILVRNTDFSLALIFNTWLWIEVCSAIYVSKTNRGISCSNFVS